MPELTDVGYVQGDTNAADKAFRSTPKTVTWATAITLDQDESNNFYIDASSATANWTMAASNIPATNYQAGNIVIKASATYNCNSGWSADFENTPAALSTTGTDVIPYQTIGGDIILGSLVNY